MQPSLVVHLHEEGRSWACRPAAQSKAWRLGRERGSISSCFAGHLRLAAVVELLAKALLDGVSVVAGVRIDVELLHVLVDDLAVPVGNRDCLRRGRDSVPHDCK